MPTERPTIPPRRTDERATAVVLVPTLVLVVTMLMALAVDAAALRAEQSRARSVVESAADDAAGMIDARRVQADGTVAIDPGAAERVALAHLRIERLPGVIRDIEIRPSAETVEVRVVLEVRRLLLGTIPGGGRTAVLPIRAVARLDPPAGPTP